LTNELLIKENTLIYNDNELDINDLFTDELYEISNNSVDYYKSDLVIVNEVFLSLVQPMLALKTFIKKNDINVIKLINVSDSFYPIVIDFSKKYDIKLIGNINKNCYKRIISAHFMFLFSVFYLLWKMLLIPRKNKLAAEIGEFSVIRTPAAKKKLSILDNAHIVYESLNDKQTIYSYFGRFRRIGWVINAWVKSYKELNKYKVFTNNILGKSCASRVYIHYCKRVCHTLLYKNMIDYYFSIHKDDVFYTGNNLDRYAIIEEQLAKKYQVKTICIPHGLEYGFKMPHPFTCDIFYTTSNQAAVRLNRIYETNKFVYDEEIAEKMFTVSYNLPKDKRIVFFTEPREVYVNLNIINELLPLMQENNIPLSIKLHPKDNKADYMQYEGKVCFVDNFSESVTQNICFSRKSTTLLEAIYNGSLSGAILINEKDKAVFNTFPSLQDDKIFKFYSIKDLYDWINMVWFEVN
jgi:hypothetical protein